MSVEALITKKTTTALTGVLSRNSGSYLLVGDEGVGKYYSLLSVVKRKTNDPASLIVVEPVKKTVGIEQIHDLNRRLRLKAGAQATRVVLIRDADKMTVPAQNAALKTLEEPPANTLIFLTAAQKSLLLPTIISRLEVIPFVPLDTQKIRDYLTSKFNITSEKAAQISELSNQRLGLAVTLASNPDSLASALKTQQLVHDVLEAKDPYQAFKLIQDEKEIVPEKLIEELLSQTRSKLREAANSDNIDDIAICNRQAQRYHQLLSYVEANGSPKLALNQMVLSQTK